MDFGEVITAMVTPFDEHLEVDIEKTKSLVEHLIQNGSDSILVSGSTGETPTLTQPEKLLLFETVHEQANGRVKIIANAGNNDTRDSLQFIAQVEKQNVVDGIMIVNPYYNKPSQKGLYMHFKTLAESTNLPVIIYNIPGRTGVNLEAKTMIELAKIPNVIGIKESSGNLSQMAQIIEGTTDDFVLYSGDDNMTLPALSIGAKGVISVASHVVGNDIKEMIHSFKEGDTLTAASIHRRLLPFFEGIFFTTNPVPIKHILNEIGVEVGGVRLPLVELDEEEKKKAKELLQFAYKVL